MRSLCYWKGVASYFNVDTGTASERHVAWTYRHPSPFARRIKNHVAFWPGSVMIRPSEDEPSAAGQTQHAFGDDIAQDLRGAACDRQAPVHQHLVHILADLRIVGGEHRGRAVQVDD